MFLLGHYAVSLAPDSEDRHQESHDMQKHVPFFQSLSLTSSLHLDLESLSSSSSYLCLVISIWNHLQTQITELIVVLLVNVQEIGFINGYHIKGLKRTNTTKLVLFRIVQSKFYCTILKSKLEYCFNLCYASFWE